jgi:hypothetical protein
MLNFNSSKNQQSSNIPVYSKIINSIKENVQFGSSKIEISIESLKETLKKDMERRRNSEVVILKKDIPVFNSTSYNNMKITSYDFEKITHISSELSSIDQAKVNSFLANSDAEGVKNALKLIKTRLGDEDFELIKDIWLKVSKK